MAWKKIVQRLGSVQPCCPKCRSMEIRFPQGFKLSEVAPAECPKCGWTGVFRETDGVPVPNSS